MRPGLVTDPLQISAAEGLILMEGRPGVAMALTPAAAVAVAERLMDCVVQAIGETGGTMDDSGLGDEQHGDR